MKDKRMLMVIDYQNDFVDGSLGFEEAKKLDEGILELVKEYISNGENVVFTLDYHGENYLDTQEGKKLPIEHCLVNTDGAKLYGKTGEFVHSYIRDYFKNNVNSTFFMKCSKSDQELLTRLSISINSDSWTVQDEIDIIKILDICTIAIVPKKTFGAIDLQEDTAVKSMDEVKIVGVVTNMCVISNAVMAKSLNPEANIIIDASLCNSFDKEAHNKALDIMETMQMEVINR